MNREMIESFTKVVQLQTISAAAEALYVSQSTVSYRLQMLEQDLGVTLFIRQRGFKKILLTKEGEAFYPMAQQWLELDTRMHRLYPYSSLGPVRIGSVSSMNQYLLPPLLQEIRRLEPRLQLEFTSYHSQEVYRGLLSHQLDLGFAFQPIHYDLSAIPVFAEPMFLITPPGSVYPDGPIHPSQLKKQDEVYFTWNTAFTAWNDEWWNEHERPYVKLDSCALMSTFLMMEPTCWAICPISVATGLQQLSQIKVHPLTVTPPDRICYLLQRKSNDNEGVALFLKLFARQLVGHPWAIQEAL